MRKSAASSAPYDPFSVLSSPTQSIVVKTEDADGKKPAPLLKRSRSHAGAAAAQHDEDEDEEEENEQQEDAAAAPPVSKKSKKEGKK